MSPAEITEIAEVAWNETKDDVDPVFSECQVDYRQKMVAHAESVDRAGLPTEGASAFELKVAELLKDPAAARVALAHERAKAAAEAADAAVERAKEAKVAAAAEVKEAKAEAKEVKAEAKAAAKEK